MELQRVDILSIQKELPTNGHKPLLGIGNDFNTYVIKNGKGVIPPISILNEFLAVFFLKYWELPYIQDAVISCDPGIISFGSLDPLYHKKNLYENKNLFGSQYRKELIEFENIYLTSNKSFYNKIEHPEIIFKLGLFDLWLENEDRRNSNYNLLMAKKNSGKVSFFPIDHSFILMSMDYKDLDVDSYSPIWNENLFESDLGSYIKKFYSFSSEEVKLEEAYFQNVISNCHLNFRNFANILSEYFPTFDEVQIQYLENYLFNEERNKKVFQEFLKHIAS